MKLVVHSDLMAIVVEKVGGNANEVSGQLSATQTYFCVQTEYCRNYFFSYGAFHFLRYRVITVLIPELLTNLKDTIYLYHILLKTGVKWYIQRKAETYIDK